jgi:hypothetical protein
MKKIKNFFLKSQMIQCVFIIFLMCFIWVICHNICLNIFGVKNFNNISLLILGVPIWCVIIKPIIDNVNEYIKNMKQEN